VEVVIQLIYLFVDRTCELAGYSQSECMMQSIVFKEHPDSKYLKHNKCNEGKIPPNEKENITHERISAFC
jgi:hypothetical protein